MRIIYIYQNKFNLKIYVGQTKDLIKRQYQHKYKSLSKNINYPLYNSIKKYGLDNFNILELEQVDDIDADEAEQFYIQFFRSWDKNYGYNIDLGGCDNKIMSQQTKDKISTSNKKYYEIYPSIWLGKKHTDKSKQTMSLSQKGKKVSNETRQKLSEINSGENNPMFGKHHTKEAKRAISSVNGGKCYNTPEHMKKLHKNTGDRLRGTHLSQEIKNKISNSRKGQKHANTAKQKMSKTRIERGTFAKENNPMFGKTGELNPNSKLNWEIINNIRLDYSSGLKGKKLMQKYNISETHMYRILKNEIWKV